MLRSIIIHLRSLAAIVALALLLRAAIGAPTSAEVGLVRGHPQLFLNGVMASRVTARAALPGRYAPEKLEKYRSSGIDVYITAIDEPVSVSWDGASGYY